MPLFTNKFAPKKAPPRKNAALSPLSQSFDGVRSQEEFGLDYGPIKLKLGNTVVGFEDGDWHVEKEGTAMRSSELTKLKKQNQQLTEENNLLKLKIEILYNMLAETTAEIHLQEREIEGLKEAHNIKTN